MFIGGRRVATSSASFERSSFEAAPFDGPGVAVLALSLDHDDSMVSVARHVLGTWLRERGCRSGDDAVLVLSELVTNAITHATGGCTLEVRHRDDLVRLEVRDRSPQAPVMRVVDASHVGGRGLYVVDAIAETWGWEPTAEGKRVWAIVHAPLPPP
jgi:anti-sigma regulatory factor (Ser/Thr protein kinase)